MRKVKSLEKNFKLIDKLFPIFFENYYYYFLISFNFIIFSLKTHGIIFTIKGFLAA